MSTPIRGNAKGVRDGMMKGSIFPLAPSPFRQWELGYPICCQILYSLMPLKPVKADAHLWRFVPTPIN